MSEQYKNQLLPYIARKQKLYLCNIRHIFSISCQKHFLEGIFLEMVKTVTFRNPLGSLHGNFNNFNTNGVMPAGKFKKVPATFDNLPPYSPRSTVPVSGAQTGTVNSPAADTVPVIVPVLGTKTGTVESPNPLCHKASPSPNIDKDKYFHSVNSSQYDSIRTENSSKNGSIHNPTDYRIF